MKLYMKGRIMAATPIICVIAYLLMGFLADLWHPGWVVFLAIPLVAAILFNKSQKLVTIYSMIIAIAYIIIGFTTSLWHPFWILFLTIPIVAIFAGPRNLTAEELEDIIDNHNDGCDCGCEEEFEAEFEEKFEKKFEEKFNSKDKE